MKASPAKTLQQEAPELLAELLPATTLHLAGASAWSKLSCREVVSGRSTPAVGWLRGKTRAPKKSPQQTQSSESPPKRVFGGGALAAEASEVVPNRVIELAEARVIDGLLQARPPSQPQGHTLVGHQSSTTMNNRARRWLQLLTPFHSSSRRLRQLQLWSLWNKHASPDG